MRKAMKMKKILVPTGCVMKLAEEFGVSRNSVNSALGYVTQSELAHNIREAATKKYGGVDTVVPRLL